MQASLFNLRVPLADRNEVFLMNTLSDAQLVVSSDVAALLDRCPDVADANEDVADANEDVADANEDVGSGFSRISEESGVDTETREAIAVLRENGFLVPSHEHDRRSLAQYLADVKQSTAELNITVLTTLQCNFACDYCFQGDHGDYNKFADKMSLETAARVADWVERELDRLHPETLVVTFFGGEPLLNLPVMYLLAERFWLAGTSRGVPVSCSIITNGLLLTEEIVDRLLPFGLRGVKITLDGDREAHNRLRPLRGGQGTFDRIIDNIRRVSDRCGVAIGGNFEDSSVESYPALLDFLKAQPFADRLVKVNFKPIVRNPAPEPVTAPLAKGVLPLIPVGANGQPLKPLGGTCMTAAGSGGASTCDACHLVDDHMTFLRQETRARGFPTPDGVHNGPCHVHLDHAHTIGPDGSLYACPGFTGEKARSVGHIDDRRDPRRMEAREEFDRLRPWNACGDCAFIPVCAGGCVVASHTTLGDMNTPTCHKRSYESAVIALAHQVAGAA